VVLQACSSYFADTALPSKIQGLGTGGILSLVQVIITDIVSMRERGKYTAMTAFAWALGTNIGVSALTLSDSAS
jgi:MFS family permease